MDAVKTGRFLSELRKKKGLTQERLGEKLGVGNKTVSRWETGSYLPPADALLALSELFDVSVNELLSGHRLEKSESTAAAEENLSAVEQSDCFSLQEKTDFFKRKWLKEHIAFMLVSAALLLTAPVAGFLLKNVPLICAPVLLLPLFHCIRYNRMMAYVEKHVFELRAEGRRSGPK